MLKALFKKGVMAPLLLLSLWGAAPLREAAAAEKARIAVVVSASIPPYDAALKGFFDRLDEMKVVYEAKIFYLDKIPQMTWLVDGVRLMGPHLIHTIGTKATREMKGAFPERPVVFSMVLNPVASGLTAGLNRPGGAVTGAAMDVSLAGQFEFIKRIVPGARRIGVLYSEAETGLIVAEASGVAGRMGLRLVAEAVGSPAEVPAALGRMKGNVDILWSVADGNVFTPETTREILVETLREKLPFMGLSRAFVKAGALAALETDPGETGGRAALLAAALLKGGNPAHLPVSFPGRVTLLVNGPVAELLGLPLPAGERGEVEVMR